MNKTELVAAVAEKAEISKKDADSAVNAVIESIIEAVAVTSPWTKRWQSCSTPRRPLVSPF